jgi:hypothetical protein
MLVNPTQGSGSFAALRLGREGGAEGRSGNQLASQVLSYQLFSAPSTAICM